MHSSFPFLGANHCLGIDQVRMEVYVTHQNVSRFWDLKQSARTTRREEAVLHLPFQKGNRDRKQSAHIASFPGY